MLAVCEQESTTRFSAPVVTDRPAPGYVLHVATREDADDALASAFAAGRDDALEIAYQRYGSMIHGFCVKKIGATRAPDATQETFVAAWRTRERFDPERGSLAGWLMGIARFKALDEVRSRDRVERIDERAKVEVTPEPDDASEIAEQLLVADALSRLADRPREVVELAFFSELTHAEIAQKTGYPLGTIKSDIRRALQRLRIDLESVQ